MGDLEEYKACTVGCQFHGWGYGSLVAGGGCISRPFVSFQQVGWCLSFPSTTLDKQNKVSGETVTLDAYGCLGVREYRG